MSQSDPFVGWEQALTALGEWETRLRDYFAALDGALEVLAHKQEGRLSQLPGFALSIRDIRCGVTPDGRGVVITITPAPQLEEDRLSIRELNTVEDLVAITTPFGLYFAPPAGVTMTIAVKGDRSDADVLASNPNGTFLTPAQISEWSFTMVGGVTLRGPGDHTFLPPLMLPSPYVGFGRSDEASPQFSMEAAKQKAIELWNNLLTGERNPKASFVQCAQNVFATFQSIIKRKSFLERRVHRFLHEHALLLLPSHVGCHFEVSLSNGGERRRADFILEREAGLAPLLVELESPACRVFRADGDLAAEANHAVAQITDWVRLIELGGALNLNRDFSFLAGPKERLVVIGRGTDNRERMLNSRFGGTTVWTYDLLLEQARRRWNNELSRQQKQVGLPEVRPF